MRKLLAFIMICLVSFCCRKTDLKNLNLQSSTEVSAPANNGTEQTRDVPVDATFFNDCCNEEVHVSGTAHFTDNNNVHHVLADNLTGVGLSTGFSYVSLSPSVLANVFYSNEIVGIFSFMLNMKNSNGCSFRIKATFQSHVNAGGDITVFFQNYETFCH